MGPDPDELEELLQTPHICASCEEQLFTTDELVLIQAVYPNVVDGEVQFYQLDDGFGHFEYEPMFLHLDCWEELAEELYELMEDAPPMLDVLSLFECTVCKSGIRPWETSCLVTPGELRHSPRSPTGNPMFYFDPCLGDATLLCASCTVRLNEEVFEMWENFSHNGECPEGTHKRCWRWGECSEVCQDIAENW